MLDRQIGEDQPGAPPGKAPDELAENWRRARAGDAVDPETGTIVWPGGADLAPDTLYERVRTGAWTDSRAAA